MKLLKDKNNDNNPEIIKNINERQNATYKK